MNIFEKLPEICKRLKLGEIIDRTSLPKNFTCNTHFQIQTTLNTFLLKLYPLDKKNQLKSSVFIKKIFTGEENRWCEWKNRLWVASPWHEGKVLALDEITLSHVEIIAKKLADMHKRKIEVTPAFHVLSIAPSLKAYAEVLLQNLVISHGDLLPQNVVWNLAPIIIDWDNAGLINQELELFNTAINWAGIESDFFKIDYYKYFIQKYYEAYPRTICIDEVLIKASLSSWLAWWEKTKDARVPRIMQFLIDEAEVLSFEVVSINY